jgi:acyl carrier protein
MAPAAYPLYLFHFPLAQYWVLLREELNIETNALDRSDYNPADPNAFSYFPLAWWEFLLFVPLATALALFVAHVLNARVTAMFMNNFNTLYSCCSCVCGSQEGSLVEAGAQNALFTILDVVSGLTGADADGTTPITQLGLDSFGASALVGILRSRVPDVPIKVADVYALETVGDIASLIERTRGENNKKIVGSPVLSEV